MLFVLRGGGYGFSADEVYASALARGWRKRNTVDLRALAANIFADASPSRPHRVGSEPPGCVEGTGSWQLMASGQRRSAHRDGAKLGRLPWLLLGLGLKSQSRCNGPLREGPQTTIGSSWKSTKPQVKRAFRDWAMLARSERFRLWCCQSVATVGDRQDRDWMLLDEPGQSIERR